MIHIPLMDSKVQLVIVWILTNYISADTNTEIPDKTLLNAFLKEYIRPYVQSLKDSTDSKFRAKEESEIGKFIKDKIKQLAPFLQDDSVAQDDDKLTLEGEDETTIVEFAPNMKARHQNQDTRMLVEKSRSFKMNVDKYKKLRTKIKKALKKEQVTNRTRIMVTTTLDEMIAQMIANQCWKNSAGAKAGQNRPNVKIVTDNWEQLWEKLKKEYVNPQPRSNDRQDNFLKKFQELMTMMSNDLSTLVNKYKVVCQLTDAAEEPEVINHNILRNVKGQPADLKSVAEKELQGHDFDEKLPCDSFRVCSDELKDFMIDFYVNLNDTAVAAVRNYAAMFLRDVSDDSYHEKERVVNLINKGGDSVEEKITKIFKKQTEKFKLDSKKNKYSNMRYLYKYISKNIEHVKTAIHRAIQENLKSVREKLMQNIQKDIDVNVDVDLGNLEREIGGRICPSFEICNGKFFAARRRNYVGNKHVYVKVKFDLEVDKNDTDTRRSKKNDTVKIFTTYKNFRVIWTRSPLNLSVTRTPRLKVQVKLNRKNNKFKKYIPPTTVDTSESKKNILKRSQLRKSENYNTTLMSLRNKPLSEILRELIGQPEKENEIPNEPRSEKNNLTVIY